MSKLRLIAEKNDSRCNDKKYQTWFRGCQSPYRDSENWI